MNFEEKTLSSECVYDGKIMKVCRDAVEIATGKKSFREIVHHSGGVVIAALKNENTILAVKQFRYPLKQTIVELPAGKLEIGENPDLAAARELEEETGYKAKNWKSLGFIYTSPGYSDEKLYLYLATDLEFVGEHPDDGEILKVYEFPLDNFIEDVKNGKISDAKTVCTIMRAFYD
uniref:NUDIX domain-containing protein n=1 Tax=Candidatus Scatousia sp. TaxID=3085663 RepID=UPI00402810BF